ncbi:MULTISPECIES: hypothetical protein [unclassified Tolypothrix]|uniref:hypothetical protein n=1 Tax=unclassified Tolypothrix TaxID=2649714 RepID=UPI0005EAA87E|nr:MULTISPECIES: hypothetical protein [unclassified Tolypothrix]BAY90308.1 hypothetical protein NIES3275_23200 [Microchaete diplosiphon NIES-3275]EKE98869.1 hypothetical protein FDUTEX481_03673 [Tolypothrix sp. PCC 7601]MBE9086593.1 hypothetical protein [Tolypothrix sp. LEGE 11397]UYD24492.1 hypothetical protein HGR01_23990 [Tolypothrix sp. PCC 7712]UYD33277.1 hypothetical protein HG267_30680 [Tolypothrix sp. PCC 7601]
MNQRQVRSQVIYPDSLVIAVFICLLTILCLLQISGQFLHWFVIPVTLCGILIGIDAIDWFRGQLNLFDPVGIIGLLGFHFFFVAPLLHVGLDFWIDSDIIPPTDWRPWLGGMAILNFLGLGIYRFTRNIIFNATKNQPTQTIWQINHRRFFPIISIALIISASLQLLVYQKFGGILNYIEAANRSAMGGGENEFQGMGILFVLSESFPILAMMAFTIYAQHKKPLHNVKVLLAALIIFLILQFLFGGLRGSRSNTIWAMFWAVGIIHFWLRQISKKQIAIGLVFLVLFMYIYGFFKTGGLEAVNTALQGQEARVTLEEKSGRSWQSLVLQDLGRSDVQAFLLYRILRQDSDYEYAWGRTYLPALTMLIPSAIMPDKPPDKMKEGTEVQYGKGTYDPIFLNSSKVYGLAGETMLNFGPYVVPIAFITLGIVVGKVRRCLCNWTMGDDRLLMLPFLINFCFIILASDSDNYIFFLFKNGSLASFVIFLTSDRKVIPNPNLEPRHLKSKFLNKHTLYKIEQRHKNRSLSK